MEEKPSRIMVSSKVHNDYKIRLARPITEADDFDDEFQVLAAAGEDDTVHFDICSGGGLVDTAVLIRRAITNCEGHTKAYIGPTCASAATAIALACDSWEVDDVSSFMVHTVQYGHAGYAPHVKANIAHSDMMVERFVRSCYTGFLTEEEILQVLDAREIYFEGEELAERLMAYAEYRDAVRQATYEESLDLEPQHQ